MMGQVLKTEQIQDLLKDAVMEKSQEYGFGMDGMSLLRCLAVHIQVEKLYRLPNR